MVNHYLLKKSLYLALLSTLSFNVQGGGIILYEVGSDDVGLASAGNSARAQDPSTLLTNPAGLCRLSGNQFFVGAQVLYEDIEFTTVNASPFLGQDSGGDPVDLFPGGSLFYSYSISDNFKAGLGIYGNFGSVLKYHGDWVGRYSTVKATLLGTSIQPTLAYRLNQGLSIGGGPVIMYGSLRSKTRINNSPFQLTDFHDGELKLSDRAWGLGANVGAIYEFDCGSRIGIAYNSEIKLNFKPDAIWTDLALPLNTVLTNRGLLNSEVDIGIRVPQGVMASLFYQFNQEWALLSSVGWQEWSKFGQVELGIASNNPVSVTIDKQYKDTWHVALGAQHPLSCHWLLNFGVSYDSRFQPTENIPLNTPANSAWRFGIGSHWYVNRCLDLGLNFEYIHSGDLQVNDHGLVKGDLTGAFKQPSVYFLAVNLNWKQS
ncbi:MAG: OmpP1/FadL family transporter [Candidatus Berkiella sp.]